LTEKYYVIVYIPYDGLTVNEFNTAKEAYEYTVSINPGTVGIIKGHYVKLNPTMLVIDEVENK